MSAYVNCCEMLRHEKTAHGERTDPVRRKGNKKMPTGQAFIVT